MPLQQFVQKIKQRRQNNPNDRITKAEMFALTQDSYYIAQCNSDFGQIASALEQNYQNFVTQI